MANRSNKANDGDNRRRPAGGRGRSTQRATSANSSGRSSGSSRPHQGKQKRIPPPPPEVAEREPRQEIQVERVPMESSSGGTGRARKKRNERSSRRSSRRSGIDVTDVHFPGLASTTEAKLQDRLIDAAAAFESERFSQAEQLLQSIHRLAPGVPEVHELLGLTHYRLGRWVKAIAELQRFYEISNSVSQHPVWADCCRALRRWNQAEALWKELGDASPGPELVEEGRIVQAGALADRGRVADAIRFLERAPKVRGRPGTHHLRRWYMLGDLYERAGDTARARRLFSEIAGVDSEFGDAAARSAAL